MKGSELRIGNVVLANDVNEGKLVPYIIKSGADIDNAKWFWPVELGNNDDGITFDLKNTYISITGNTVEICYAYGREAEDIVISHIESLHQLQNLYHSLEGVEMPVTIPKTNINNA